MKRIVKKNICCGCYACVNICSKNAIVMHEEIDGFKYPIINQNKCINCGMCKKICPILNKSKKEEYKTIAYACYNMNIDNRLNSSSGGIFILLAREIIRRNGVVFGATFDKKFDVLHSHVETEGELKSFMGSKYVQSNIGNTYKKVKKFLEDDRYVLFTGTPCQINGLKSYLRKDYNKLYTQDIICHGVPSPKVWRKYLEYQKKLNMEEIKSVSFRNKDNGWSLYQMKISFDTKIYSKSATKDLFFKMFLGNFCLRESCYNCNFKKKNQVADLTLADYWGIKEINPRMYDDQGTSLVIINSNKGKELFELIKNSIRYEETKLEEAIKYNPSIIKSASLNYDRKNFMKDIDKIDFVELQEKYFQKKKLIRRIVNKIRGILRIR